MTTKLEIATLRTDGGTQIRAALDSETVNKYAERLGECPPIVVYYDGEAHWLADGFHRVAAAKQLGQKWVLCVVQSGTRRDAILHAVGANETHGLPRTNADKRRAVETLLRDEEWSKWSDREIARHAKVSAPFVATVRADSSVNRLQIQDPRTVQRNGVTYQQNTANIGKRPDPKADAEAKADAEPKQEAERAAPYASATPAQPAEPARAQPVASTQQGKLPVVSTDGARRVFTLDAWNAMRPAEHRAVLRTAANTTNGFNKQDAENAEDQAGNIEWARWSWNPVTGCKHDCPYCYARDMATRFYEQGFEPSLIPERLRSPFNVRVPKLAETDVGHRNVFTCSMADLFGRWVPREWILAVLETVRECPQWNFLFLTKFPLRMAEFEFPPNAWVGTSVDCQARVKNAEDAFRKVKASVKWLSCEPMIEPLHFSELSLFQWIVIGGASASSLTPEWHPPRAWVNDLEAAADKVGVKVYEKTNLLRRRREYPGATWAPPTEAPSEFHYLGSARGHRAVEAAE